VTKRPRGAFLLSVVDISKGWSSRSGWRPSSVAGKRAARGTTQHRDQGSHPSKHQRRAFAKAPKRPSSYPVGPSRPPGIDRGCILRCNPNTDSVRVAATNTRGAPVLQKYLGTPARVEKEARAVRGKLTHLCHSILETSNIAIRYA